MRAPQCAVQCRMTTAAIAQGQGDWLECGPGQCTYAWAANALYKPNPLISAVESVKAQRRRRWRRRK